MELISAYEYHKTTEQYKAAVRRSQKQQQEQNRLSKQLWWAQYNHSTGRYLATKVQDGAINFDDLDSDSQQLFEDFESRKSAKKN